MGLPVGFGGFGEVEGDGEGDPLGGADGIAGALAPAPAAGTNFSEPPPQAAIVRVAVAAMARKMVRAARRTGMTIGPASRQRESRSRHTRITIFDRGAGMSDGLVTTTSGPVRGRIRDGVAAFLGIPYAAS